MMFNDRSPARYETNEHFPQGMSVQMMRCFQRLFFPSTDETVACVNGNFMRIAQIAARKRCSRVLLNQNDYGKTGHFIINTMNSCTNFCNALVYIIKRRHFVMLSLIAGVCCFRATSLPPSEKTYH